MRTCDAGLDQAIDPLPRRFLKMDRRVKPARDKLDHSSEAPLLFVLSKTFGAAVLPINFMIELGIVSVVLMATRFAAFGRKLAVATLDPAGARRVFAARQSPALSAGVALSAVGSVARCARWHHCARRLRRHRPVGGASHAGRVPCGRSPVRAGRARAPLSECAHRFYRRQREPRSRQTPGKPTTPRRSWKISASRRSA